MVAVMAAYLVLARRFRILWHPVVLAAAVTLVGVVVSVAGELMFRGSAGVPAMVQRSAIGGAGWGVVIALAVWIWRRLFVSPAKPR
jgi:hypothetical protein